MDKVVATPTEAIAGITDGMTLAVGGFGLCGIPSVLIAELHRQGIKDLEAVSNNCGVDDWGLGILLGAQQIRRMISSYVGENKEFARQYLVGSQVADGGLPWKYAADGSVEIASPPKEVRTFSLHGQPREYVLEEAIVADFGLVRAARGDRHGNLVFNRSSRNFNPLAAMAGRITVAEVPTRSTCPASMCSGCCH